MSSPSSGLSFRSLPRNFIYIFLFSPISCYMPSPAHPIILYLVTRPIFDDKYVLWSSSVCSHLQFHVIFTTAPCLPYSYVCVSPLLQEPSVFPNSKWQYIRYCTELCVQDSLKLSSSLSHSSTQFWSAGAVRTSSYLHILCADSWTAEFETWRCVKQPEGLEGHQSIWDKLYGTRMFKETVGHTNIRTHKYSKKQSHRGTFGQMFGHINIQRKCRKEENSDKYSDRQTFRHTNIQKNCRAEKHSDTNIKRNNRTEEHSDKCSDTQIFKRKCRKEENSDKYSDRQTFRHTNIQRNCRAEKYSDTNIQRNNRPNEHSDTHIFK